MTRTPLAELDPGTKIMVWTSDRRHPFAVTLGERRREGIHGYPGTTATAAIMITLGARDEIICLIRAPRKLGVGISSTNLIAWMYMT